MCTQPCAVILVASRLAGGSLQAVIKATDGCDAFSFPLSDTTNTTQVDVAATIDFAAMDALCFEQLCLVMSTLCWLCMAYVVKL